MNGKVHFFRTVDSNNTGLGSQWSISLPDNTIISAGCFAPSSTTQGLQEALDYAHRYGWDFEAFGGTLKPAQWPDPFIPWDTISQPADVQNAQDPACLVLQEPLVFRAWQKGVIDFGSMSLLYNGTDSAIKISSNMMCDINLRCQIVCTAAQQCVLIQPDDALPFDPWGPVVTAGTIRIFSTIPNANGTNQNGKCIYINATSSPIRGQHFEFHEPNGGSAGVFIDGTVGFSENVLDIINCHAQTSACVVLGANAASGAGIKGNIINATMAGSSTCAGISNFGYGNIIRAICKGDESNNGKMLRGIVNNPGSDWNHIVCPTNESATKYINSGGANNYYWGKV